MSKATVKKAEKRGPGRPSNTEIQARAEAVKQPEGVRAAASALTSLGQLEGDVNNLLAKIGSILGPTGEESAEKAFKPNPAGCGLSQTFEAINFTVDGLRRRIKAASARVQF